MFQKLIVVGFSICLFFYCTGAVLADNDIVIDGDSSDWTDESGFATDPYTDTNPERTDIVQYGLVVVDNGAVAESLALIMVTDDYQNTGNARGDSHQLVFYVGAYEIVVIVQNGCDAINEVTIDGTATSSYSAAAAPVSSPINAPTDTTPDCLVEIEFPLSALPTLDTNANDLLLDESFATAFATRQSGGVGNDNDNGSSNLSPTAVSLQSMTASGDEFGRSILLMFTGLFCFTLLLWVCTKRTNFAKPVASSE